MESNLYKVFIVADIDSTTKLIKQKKECHSRRRAEIYSEILSETIEDNGCVIAGYTFEREDVKIFIKKEIVSDLPF